VTKQILALEFKSLIYWLTRKYIPANCANIMIENNLMQLH